MDLQAPSFYREYAPRAELRAFIACTWVKIVAAHERAAPFAVIPDGCIDVIVRDHGAPYVAGPATRSHIQPSGAGHLIVGIRFRPGAARRFLGSPAHELRDRDVALADILAKRDRPDLDAGAICNPAALRRSFELWAFDRLDRNGADDASLVRAARSMMLDPTLPLDRVAGRLDWNARRLHREFSATCGYGPKTLQRILRVQSVIRAAQDSAAPPGLAQLAVDAGYADQSHMTRDFQALVGQAPATYLSANGYDANFWMRTFA